MAVRMAAILGGFIFCDGASEFFYSADRPRAELAEKIIGFYRHKEDAAIVGIGYLKSVREEVDVRSLIDLICPRNSDRYRTLTQASSDEARDIFVAWQCEDFEHGRIVNVSGWLLSETEVRACALIAVTMGIQEG